MILYCKSCFNSFNSKLILFVFIFVLCSFNTLGQRSLLAYFSEIELMVGAKKYSYTSDRVLQQGEYKLPFEFETSASLVEFRLYPRIRDGEIIPLTLNPSSDYEIIDSLQLRVDGFYHCRVRFKDLLNTEFLNLNLAYKNAVIAVPLLPYTQTMATIYPGNAELYIGEERSFEIVSNYPENIIVNPIWVEKEGYEYRIHSKDGKIYYSIIATKSDEIEVELPIELYRPNIEEKRVKYELPKQTFSFNVKGSRLRFLTFDKKEVILASRNAQGIEVQIDNNRFLEINKTYRLEATDERGGPLIAELFTVRRLSNDRVLCMFRPYNFHKSSGGYLFIKDGDVAKFITNINILPEPIVSDVSILRKGGSWVRSKQVYPGETVSIRLEGEGLSRTDIKFEDLIDISSDSLIVNESVSHHLLRVPVDIRKKSVNIYSGNEKTGVSLDIVEYQRPRPLDFVSIDYGDKPSVVTDITQPILYDKTIGDIKVSFDDLKIDDDFTLYGKQYLEIEIRIMNENNILIEKQLIDDIIICPGKNSPRSFSYSGLSECMNEPISINDYLSNKTHNLNNWAKVELIIKHRKNLYEGQGYTSRIEIIRAKYLTFDVDLSVPAGLIIKKVGEPGFPGLSGISLAMLAQFSFYQKGEIKKQRPFKVGAGFLAKNAFNFNPEAERDLGIVILGSVYPTTKGRKISFPLYFGTGFYLYDSKFFFLIGPGVSINF